MDLPEGRELEEEEEEIHSFRIFFYRASPRPLLHRGVTGQNGSGQNGTDKMVWTKWYKDKMALDKMVWTKWYGQNGSNFWNRL